MRIITEPSVYLVSRQQVDETALQEFLDANDVGKWDTDTSVAAEKIVEISGRLCYMSFAKPRPGGNKAYTEHILAVGHGSVLEHSVFGFIIEGVSRSLTHELVRHRAGFGYSQLSQRYVDESDTAFVVPPAMLSHHEEWTKWLEESRVYKEVVGDWDSGLTPNRKANLFQVWLNHVEDAKSEYAMLAEDLASEMVDIPEKTARIKAAREAARSVLPNCTETKIFVTGNARAWRHLLEMRGSVHADAEIRRLAIALLAVLQKEAPNLFGDYRVLKADNGRDCIHTDYHKV